MTFKKQMNPYIGVGLYSISEASKISGVSSQRIRRWLNGYTYNNNNGERKDMPALWQSEIEEIRSDKGLTFKDLLEIRFVDAFVKEGVSLKLIREAAKVACEEYKQAYPLSSQKFKTDGKRIFINIAQDSDDDKVVDVINRQWAFSKIVSPSFKGIEFSMDGSAERWFPMGKSNLVVLDPCRSFGRPIVTDAGIPTSILAQSYRVEEDINLVSKIYDVPVRSVKAAISYEERLAA